MPVMSLLLYRSLRSMDRAWNRSQPDRCATRLSRDLPRSFLLRQDKRAVVPVPDTTAVS
jgi:hypothetical protein